MSPRLGIAVAITVVVVCLSVFGAIVLRSSVDSSSDEAEEGTGVAIALQETSDAIAPFEGLTEARLALADRCLRVAVADEDSERHDGLRGIADLEEYDGMLFVYGTDTEAQFTMAGTPLTLDIGWYAADGQPVDRTTMQPCLDGNDATCPTYASSKPFRYVLETEAGNGGAGAIGACPG